VCVFDIKLAAEHNVKFFETSAKSSINVEEAFVTLSRDIKAKIDKKTASICSQNYIHMCRSVTTSEVAW